MAGPIRISVLMDAGKAKKEIDDTGSRLSRFASGLGKVGLPIAGLGLGIAKLGGGLLDLAKGASEDDAAQRTLARTMKNTTNATDAQVASVEDYIAKTGVATGVTDDEMRPALASLVRATKDVGKAQGLMGLAMDISAGTGKDLGAVTQALAKAQNGSVGGLAKLGIATKDAEGKTKSFAQIQKDLSKTFGGQAAEAANSTAGKYARFKLVMDELGETIGGGVLPVLGFLADIALKRVFPAVSKLADVFESRVVPKLKEFGSFIQANVVPKIQELGQFITGTLVPALGKMAGFVSQNKDFFVPFAAAIIGIVTAVKIWTMAQAALNVVMAINPFGLIVIGIAALVAGLIFAFKHSDRFRAIVLAVWGGLKTFAGFITGTVVPVLQRLGAGALTILKAGFDKVKQAVTDNKPAIDKVRGALATAGGVILQVARYAAGVLIPALQKVGGFILGTVAPILLRLAGGALRSVFTAISAVVRVVGTMVTAFAGMVTGVRDGVGKVVGFVKGLPGKITGAIGGLGGLLKDAGASLISGLISGMTSKLSALRDKAAEIAGAIKGFFPGSPVKEGPLRSWNNGGAGVKLAEMLAGGLDKGNRMAQVAASGLAGSVQVGFAGAGVPVALPAAGGVQFGAGGGQVVINVYALTDGPQVGRRVVDAIQEYEALNGPSWRTVTR